MYPEHRYRSAETNVEVIALFSKVTQWHIDPIAKSTCHCECTCGCDPKYAEDKGKVEVATACLKEGTKNPKTGTAN